MPLPANHYPATNSGDGGGGGGGSSRTSNYYNQKNKTDFVA
jgi:hypothetical protein